MSKSCSFLHLRIRAIPTSPSSSCAISTPWPTRSAAEATVPRRRRGEPRPSRWRHLPLVLLLLLGGLSGVFLWAYAPDLPADVLIARYGQPPSAFVDVGGTRAHIRDQGKPDAMPLLLIGLGIYLLRGYIFRPKSDVDAYMHRDTSPTFVTAMTEPRFGQARYEKEGGFSDRTRSGAWRDR